MAESSIFEQLIRFIMMLFGAFPSQGMTTQAACVEADYGRPVLDMTLDRADALLPNDLYYLLKVDFDTYNAHLFYADSKSSLIGIATVARPCTDAEKDWGDLFNDEWFEAVYPTYVLQKERRCVYENTTLVEFEAVKRSDETLFILRYYYEPVSEVRIDTLLYTFPESREDDMNDYVGLVYPQLVTCNVTP